MKKLTKISILFIVIFVITTAYAFAAFVGKQIQPLPEPLNLIVFGIVMIGTGYFLKHRNGK